MLNYQSTSFHDALYVRDLFGLRRAPEFDDWLVRTGLADAGFRLAGNAGLLPDFASRLIADVPKNGTGATDPASQTLGSSQC
jgi:ethanolamine ammonia-lyase large subunit